MTPIGSFRQWSSLTSEGQRACAELWNNASTFHLRRLRPAANFSSHTTTDLIGSMHVRNPDDATTNQQRSHRVAA